jgi:hypothetical protein
VLCQPREPVDELLPANDVDDPMQSRAGPFGTGRTLMGTERHEALRMAFRVAHTGDDVRSAVPSELYGLEVDAPGGARDQDPPAEQRANASTARSALARTTGTGHIIHNGLLAEATDVLSARGSVVMMASVTRCPGPGGAHAAPVGVIAPVLRCRIVAAGFTCPAQRGSGLGGLATGR